MQKALVRPLGGLFILKQLGFEELDESLVLKNPNIQLLKRELPRFQQTIQQQGARCNSYSAPMRAQSDSCCVHAETPVVRIFNNEVKDMAVEVCCLLELICAADSCRCTVPGSLLRVAANPRHPQQRALAAQSVALSQWKTLADSSALCS